MYYIMIPLAGILAGMVYLLASHKPQPARLPIRTSENRRIRNRIWG